jgi:hypothetical protein
MEISIDNDQIREIFQKNEWWAEALLDLLYIYANPNYLCSKMNDLNLRWAIRHFADDMRERQRLNGCRQAKVCIEEGIRCKFAKKPKAQVLPLQIVKGNQTAPAAPEGGA